MLFHDNLCIVIQLKGQRNVKHQQQDINELLFTTLEASY